MSTYRYIPAEVWDALDELRAVVSPVEIAPLIRQAVDIAKAGGITDERLHAVLHLANTRQMTPSTEAVLANAGIDTTPWAVVTGEQKMVAADAIVIERVELPKVTARDGRVSAKAFTWSDSSPDDLREVATCYLAAAEYLDAHPPVPPVSDEDVETLAGLLWEYAQNPSGPGDTFAETNEGEHNRFRNRARRLLATGRVAVTR